MFTYGNFDPTRHDISGDRALVVDVRREFGLDVPDESQIASEGTYQLSVHGERDGVTGLFVGEILTVVDGKEVRIVGALTGRPGLVEVTPDHVQSANTDPEYASKFKSWLGLSR